MRTLFALLALLVLITSGAEARIRIDLSSPSFKPIPIAVTDFYADSFTGGQATKELASVIRNNFTHSTVFDQLAPNAYLQSGADVVTTSPSYKDWRLINADLLLTGKTETVVTGSGTKLRVEFFLYDTQAEKQILAKRYTVEPKFWRYVAHRISDDIYREVTGEDGYFATRIVYIGEESNRSGNNNLVKKLCVMDQDGANQQCLTDGRHLVLTPMFNPETQKIIYMSYESGRPRLYFLDMPTGEQTIIGDFEGLNSTPRFHPNGKRVAMTLTYGHEGNPEIYTMDVNNRKLQRLTYHRDIDTSPSYSPDGKQIVFNSTRGGSAALYIMDSDGSNVRRLTYGKGTYYAPAWSPRGDLIAFVKALNGKFHIGVIDPDGREERLLTDSFMDESPTWSPNGRVIAFSRQVEGSDKSELWSVDLTGYNLRKLPTPSNASDPAWSPLLQ